MLAQWISQTLAPTATLLGVVTGVAWVYKKYRKLENQRQRFKQERDDYEDTIDAVRTTIKDLQNVKKDGELDMNNLRSSLDKLERCALPKEERMLSKLDRIQTQIKEE